MGDRSKIEWTEATWNPVVGCTKVSPGCKHCYAERMARRLAGITATRETYGPVVNERGWNGQVRLVPDALEQPLRWRRPRRVFVCSMSDLFHGEVHFTVLDRIFAVMALAPQHTFQVLTKRAAQMNEYLAYAGKYDNLQEEIDRLTRRVEGEPFAYREIAEGDWPLPNVWLGVSAEDQAHLDERLPHLLNTPAAVRFVSLEPLLGPISFDRIARYGRDAYSLRDLRDTLHWVIVGGESGPGARPLHPDWVRSVRAQCVAAGVPFLFKQWGEWMPWNETMRMRAEDCVMWDNGTWRTGFDLDGVTMARVGKQAAGRVLDGRMWDKYPEDEQQGEVREGDRLAALEAENAALRGIVAAVKEAIAKELEEHRETE